MFHTMLETLAVALTETVPSAADAVIGPKVTSVGWSTHIHTGRPTKPARLAPDSGTMPISIGSRFIEAIARWARRSEEHTSELQSLMRISYAVFCLKKKR